jgi:ATP synthase protein I
VLSRELSTISKVLGLQLLIICLMSVAFFAAKGWMFAEWSLLGGFTAFIPNLYFSLRIRSTEGQDVKKIVNSFYVGESGKLILTVVLFMLIFQFRDVKILPLMTTYVAVLSVFWFALILRDNKY